MYFLPLVKLEPAESSSNSDRNAQSKCKAKTCVDYIHFTTNFRLNTDLCRCGLSLFYRHSNSDDAAHFIFPGSLVRSGEKPVTTMKPDPPPPPRKKGKVSVGERERGRGKGGREREREEKRGRNEEGGERGV